LIHSVGIVVPTLGKRSEYLRQCLESIRSAGQAHVLLVAPTSFDAGSLLSSELFDQVVVDPGSGLSEAINLGVQSLPATVQFINWLGDDDVLTEGSITTAARVLEASNNVVMVFGSCDYINSAGEVVWKNNSGQWAVPLLRFGPDLIPQPGALFRREAFKQAGMLKPKYDWAFDFDLFIELSKLGRLKFVDQTLAQFRWHPESLSVEFRKKSVSEASQVRVSHLPKLLRPISLLWEYPVRQATLIAGKRVTSKANSKARN
jgi:GT2 family glycosyltransferase